MRPFIILFFLVLTTRADFLLHYRFDEHDASIVDLGGGGFNGKYIPSADKDNDTNETNDPERYHESSPGGRALGFFPELQSYAVVPKTPFPEKMEELYIVLDCKVGVRSIQYLVGNKTDAGKGGFSLMRWGMKWRFQYSDGKEAYTVEGSAKVLGAYVTLSVDFTKGLVVIRENGREAARVQTDGSFIAASKFPLLLGNYPTSNKKVYAGQCFLDELRISNAPLAQAEVKKAQKTPALRCICEPVDGNERNFNGRKVLHSFKNMPVAATWIINYDRPEEAEPSLEWVLPEGVTIPEVFLSTRNSDHRHYQLVMEGNVAKIPSGQFSKDPREEISLVFETAKDVTICWRMKNGEEVVVEDAFDLVLLPEMQPLPPGRFHSHSYTLSDIAFSDITLLDRVAEAYVRSGVIGKGRYYAKYPEQHFIDERLRDKHGFILWDVSLWGGPFRSVGVYPDVPAAVDANGKEQKFLCPTALTRSEEARKSYFDGVKDSLLPSKAVVLDFEPWGIPTKGCFCAECLKAFNERFKLACADGKEVKAEHSTEWALFWTEQTERILTFMADAARAALPGVEVWDYTYLFDYDDPKAVQSRWWSIPKDPRRNEAHLDGSMLSLYHVNGKKAFDQYDASRKHLKKQLCPISFISRHNSHLGHYTPVEDVLTPRQIYLKAVMAAAQGAEIFGIYPGSWIDGAYHVALNQATTEVRQREDYYFDGQRCEGLTITTTTPNEAWCATIHKRADGRKLATIINFSRKPITVQLPEQGGTLVVEPESVAYKEY
ncbi:MAG: hypothetical protein IKP00_16940 [Victivallales bacterium]|nr:hypothetical protein [Victivallales bacterium]